MKQGLRGQLSGFGVKVINNTLGGINNTLGVFREHVEHHCPLQQFVNATSGRISHLGQAPAGAAKGAPPARGSLCHSLPRTTRAVMFALLPFR